MEKVELAARKQHLENQKQYGNDAKQTQKHHVEKHKQQFVDTRNRYGNQGNEKKLIGIQGCSQSEAAQLLTNRWMEAVRAYNDPSIDESEKPVMYSGDDDDDEPEPEADNSNLQQHHKA